MLRQRSDLMAGRVLLALLAVMASASGAQGVQSQAPDSEVKIPPAVAAVLPTSPDRRHLFVLDSAHIFTASEIEALQDSARLLKRATDVDVVFITLPTIGNTLSEDIAQAVLFLAGDGASYLTGQVLKIDGGLTLGGF